MSSVKILMIVKYTSSVADGKFLLSRNDCSLKAKLILGSLGIEVIVEQNLVAMSESVGNCIVPVKLHCLIIKVEGMV